jgi:hypothetical protein
VTRTKIVLDVALGLLGIVPFIAACSGGGGGTSNSVSETNPTCLDGRQDGNETGIDCGGSCVAACRNGRAATGPSAPGGSDSTTESSPTNGIKDGTETDVDCGGDAAPKCGEGKACAADADCEVACNYNHVCVSAPSCTGHLGGDTCGALEVGESGANHESCCRTLPVSGFTDPTHPGKTVYLDKYEITAGRVREFVKRLAAARGGNPDVKGWIAEHRPEIWDDAWNAFLPSDFEGPTITINRRLLGDPRPEDAGDHGPPGPGVILPPATDQVKHLGINYQFGSEIYVDLHGNNCGTYDGSFGFPTYFYPADILKRDGQLPRPDGKTYSGATVSANDLLDVKSMNCITNAMLQAFCAWDGGQLATDEVLDYVTATPSSLDSTSGCGTQIDDHNELLGNVFTHTVQTGGRCAPVYSVNATFDAGDNLPVQGSPLNQHNYHFPDLGNVTHDKSWEISAPGRASLAPNANGPTDMVRIKDGDEPWMDLHGNVNEAALDTNGGSFTGVFALKFRGIGYGSARSDLNTTQIKGENILRIQRPEAKAAYTGGRCMRFR